MEYKYVVISGYSDEDAPRRVERCTDLQAAIETYSETIKEISNDYEIIRDSNDPSVFYWNEGKRMRYCAVRKNSKQLTKTKN